MKDLGSTEGNSMGILYTRINKLQFLGWRFRQRDCSVRDLCCPIERKVCAVEKDFTEAWGSWGEQRILE